MGFRLSEYSHGLAIAAAIACACDSDNGTVTPTPAPPPVWSEITNLPSSITLYGLWAPRADLMIGVGAAGNIWQWDGQRWTRLVNSSAEDLFAIAGHVSGNVVAVGDNGAVLKQTLGLFSPRDAGVREHLRGVWRSDTGQFVAVGANGVIIRGNGTTWSADSTPSMASLFSVWGSSDTDIFAVGVSGTILRFDGTGWETMPSATTEILSSVGGTPAGDVYAVGGHGTVLHYNGTSWAPMTNPATGLLQSICIDCGPAATGANGTVVRFIEGAWRREEIEDAPWMYAMAGAGDQQWAVGAHAIFRHDGVTWSSENRGTVPTLRAVTSSTTTGLVAVGDNGMVVVGGPDRWQFEDAGALQRLNAAWTSPSGDVLAAGTNRIYRHTGDGWVVENQDIVEYYDIGGNSDEIFAVGSGGAIRRRVGTTWGKIPDAAVELHAVHLTDTEGYIAGNNGTILHREGDQWNTRYTRAGAILWDVATVESEQWLAIAVGAGGLSLGRATGPGGLWTPITTHIATTLYSLAHGPGGDLYAVGTNGVVLRFIDDQWAALPSPTSRTFVHAYARGGALFVCGGSPTSGGMLFRYGPPFD